MTTTAETDPQQAARRIDPAYYRRRLADAMRAPLTSIAPDADLATAARIMAADNIGALLVGAAEQPVGILTERDLTRALARFGAEAAAQRVADVMTPRIVGMPQDALLYRAIGRMRRLNLRYLPVTDSQGRYIGIVSARGLLRHRTSEVEVIADGLDVAKTPEEMSQARAALPELATHLQAEGLHGREIAAVISTLYSDMTAHAAQLAEAQLTAAGRPAPAPWCVLILGSGGRGESLLRPDQDNAIIHAGRAADDAWYKDLGTAMADILDAAGIPYCKGGVMAKNAQWRGSREEWRQRVAGWIESRKAEALLNVDIFFDLKPVYGDVALGETLRAEALAAASHAPLFLRLLAEQAAQIHPAIGFLGRLVENDGLVDLKLGGLLPLVSSARVMALRLGICETATAGRLQAVAAQGAISEEDVRQLIEAQETLLALILRQQLADITAGRVPGTRIAQAALKRRDTRQLKDSLRLLELLPDMVQGVLTSPR